MLFNKPLKKDITKMTANTNTKSKKFKLTANYWFNLLKIISKLPPRAIKKKDQEFWLRN